MNLSHDTVESNVRLGPYTHANGDGEELMAVEPLVLADARVQAELAKLELPEGSVVVVDPWIYGKPARLPARSVGRVGRSGD